MRRERSFLFAPKVTPELQLNRAHGDRHDEHQLPRLHERMFTRGLHQQTLPRRDDDNHSPPARPHPSTLHASPVAVIPGTPPKLRLLKIKQASKYRTGQLMAPCSTVRVGTRLRSPTVCVKLLWSQHYIAGCSAFVESLLSECCEA